LSRYEQIRDVLWPKGPRRDVWAVLDCARDPQIYSALLGAHNESSCLYAGNLSSELERCAPHLVQLDYEDTRLTQRLLEDAWGKSWGIFLRCDASLEKLRRHLRRFLVVLDPRGRRLVFRYYDPRVLRVYLPTCVAEELDEVFGPIDSFWTEAPDPASMLAFHRAGRTLRTDRIEIEGGPGK
jgi:hypothetical protein